MRPYYLFCQIFWKKTDSFAVKFTSQNFGPVHSDLRKELNELTCGLQKQRKEAEKLGKHTSGRKSILCIFRSLKYQGEICYLHGKYANIYG